MRKTTFLLICLSFYFAFEVEERLSISELRNEAEIFIENNSYIDGIERYEKIYDIQSLLFGQDHKSLSETLLILGDLYYRIDDEINAIRCFQGAIHIIEYNALLNDQILVAPYEYLYQIYVDNEDNLLADQISNKLSDLYALDSLSFDNSNWLLFINNSSNLLDLNSQKVILDSINFDFEIDTVQFIPPPNYIDSAQTYIFSDKFQKGVSSLSNAFINQYDQFEYSFFIDFFDQFNDSQLNQLSDFFQSSKYSTNLDIETSTYFYLALIAYQLGDYQESLYYINYFSQLMPDDIIAFQIMADNFYSNGNYIDALSHYQKILWLSPNNYLAIFKQGECFYNLNYYDDAKINFQKLLKFDPNDFNSMYYLALIDYHQNNHKASIDLFLSVLEHNSKDPNIYNYLGDSYLKTDNLKLSLSSYRKYIELDTGNPDAYYKMGFIYEQLLNLDHAFKNYKQALNIDENHAEAIYRLGVLYYDNQQFKKSLEYIRKHIIYNPDDIESLEILGIILYKLNRLPETIDTYKKLIQLDGGNIHYYQKIADSYWSLEDYNEASYYYDIITNFNEDNGNTFYNLGFIANKNSDYELAKNYLLYALNCGFINIDLYNELIYAYIQTEDYENVIPIIHEALYLAPNNSKFLFDLGGSYYHLGLYNQAIKHLKIYHTKNKQDLNATFILGVSFFYNKEYESAIDYFKLANNDKNYEILYYLGLCYYYIGDYKKSIKLCKKSLIINPKNVNAIYTLGQSYVNLGNEREAKRQLRSLLNLDISLFELLQTSFDIKFEKSD